MFSNATPLSPLLFGFSEFNIPTGSSFSILFGQEDCRTTTWPTTLVEHFVTEMLSVTMLPEKNSPDEVMYHDWTRDEFARGL